MQHENYITGTFFNSVTDLKGSGVYCPAFVLLYFKMFI
jgi:hypothetical protein